MSQGDQVGAGSGLDQGVLQKTCDNTLAARVLSASGSSFTPFSETVDVVLWAPSSGLHPWQLPGTTTWDCSFVLLHAAMATCLEWTKAPPLAAHPVHGLKRARVETGGADQWAWQRREFPGFARVLHQETPESLEYPQFPIKTLLSNAGGTHESFFSKI